MRISNALSIVALRRSPVDLPSSVQVHRNNTVSLDTVCPDPHLDDGLVRRGLDKLLR